MLYTEDDYFFGQLVLSHFELACVLWLRRISSELVLFPVFEIQISLVLLFCLASMLLCALYT